MITVLQTFWFFAGIIQRGCTGLSMTTLELTTSSFALIMFATSAAWYRKPSITRPRFIFTKNSKTIQNIREFSQVNVSKIKRDRVWRILTKSYTRPTQRCPLSGIGRLSNISAKNTSVSTFIGVITHDLHICFISVYSLEQAESRISGPVMQS